MSKAGVQKWWQRRRDRAARGRFPLHELTSRVRLDRNGEAVFESAGDLAQVIRGLIVGARESKSIRKQKTLREF